jgi:hypothetical protein
MQPSTKPVSIAADSSLPCAFDPSVVDRLACPSCLGVLRLDERSLVCVGCGRVYPVVDGIPALIAEREPNP